MADYTILSGEQHVIRQCGTCAVWHTVPKIVYEAYQREGGFWHCPNGHARGFRKGQDEIDNENIRKERDRLKQENARLDEEVRSNWVLADAERVRADKAEKATNRLKKRTSAGTCPCCSRTFSNMSKHMLHQHPGFVADGGTKVIPIKRKA